MCAREQAERERERGKEFLAMPPNRKLSIMHISIYTLYQLYNTYYLTEYAYTILPLSC